MVFSQKKQYTPLRKAKKNARHNQHILVNKSNHHTSRMVRSGKLKLMSWIVGGFAVISLLSAIIGYIVIAHNLPNPGKVTESTQNSTTFYDRDGTVLYQMYKDKNRIPAESANISDYVKKATVAIEDKDFYNHRGFDPLTIIRIPYNYVFRKGRVVGGSTLTQQLVKNTLLTNERSVKRKLKELILALEIERKFSKDEILTMYLNEAPYGGTYWGIGTASKAYFGKDPKDLSLVESAILAGLPQNPSTYSPFIGKEGAWQNRTKAVLKSMQEQGMISLDEEQSAIDSLPNIIFQKPQVAIEAPHFVFYVKQQLEDLLGPERVAEGIKIKTTLSLPIQQKVQKIASDEIAKLGKYKVGNASVVVLDSQTSQVLAMVGSADFNEEKYGKYNVATALRQPGSTMKPLLYALALENGYTAASPLMDVQTNFPTGGGPDYAPVNYDGKFRGPVELRYALGNSLNIPAVKLQALMGTKTFLERLNENGLTTFAPTDANLKRFGLALTLGGGESTLLDMTNAFSTFAKQGQFLPVQYISEITDYQGNVLYKPDDPNPKRVYKPDTSYIISDILSDNGARSMEFGANSLLNVPGKRVAVKTGTTNDKRDNYAIGFTKSVTVGAWVGNNDNSPMNQAIASGITGATPIWQKTMIELLQTKEDGFLSRPSTVIDAEVNAVLGGVPVDGFDKRTELFAKDTEPKDVSPWIQKIRVSKANGKKANDFEIASGQYDDKTFVVFEEKDPVSTDGVNRWQQGIQNWVNNQGNDMYKPPTETSDNTGDDNIAISLSSPKQGAVYTSGTQVEVRASIGSSTRVTKAELNVDGQNVKTYLSGEKDIAENLELSPGTYTIQIRAENEKGKSAETSVQVTVN